VFQLVRVIRANEDVRVIRANEDVDRLATTGLVLISVP
jgi:hypothetical protein